MEQQKDIIQAFIKLGCKCSNNGYHLYDIFNWLILKNIHVDVSPKWYKSKIEGYSLKIRNTYYKEHFNSYEEALEAGIWEAYYLINN